jgi:hypothetical protein
VARLVERLKAGQKITEQSVLNDSRVTSIDQYGSK